MKKIGVFLCVLAGSVAVHASSRKEVIKARLYAQEEAAEQAQRWRAIAQDSEALHAIFRDEEKIKRREMVAVWGQEQLAREERDAQTGCFAHIYAAPHTWPIHERYAEHRYRFSCEYGHEAQSSMFDEHGSMVDSSVAALTESPKFADILLPSKLVETGRAEVFSPKRAYISDLATTPVTFKVWREAQQMALSYAYTLFGGGLTLGVTAPFVAAKREMSYRTEVIESVRAQLETVPTGLARNADFISLYGYDADGFFKDVLRKKKMRFEPAHRLMSVGDITLFGHAALQWRFLERLQIGAAITLPYAKQKDLSVFHPVSIGNGGFVSLQGHLNVVLKKRWCGYPHFSCSVQMGMPASVTLRVPKIITIADGGTLPADLATAELVYRLQACSEPECTIPDLAQHTTAVSLQPGVQTRLRLGTIILPCASRSVQADLAYELSFKTGQRLHGKAVSDEWYTTPFATQPPEVSHRLHIALVYQPTDHIHWHIGAFATVMGRSTPQSYGWRASLSYQW